jgi:Anti-sigma-K factor rskA/Putative zinc-finger
MSGCRTHADLIGPYVLDALEPYEMDEVREHLAACPRCAAEARELARIPALLEFAHDEAPIPVPSPGLEEEVLDRFVTERAAFGGEFPHRRRGFLNPRQLALPAIGAFMLAVAIALILLLPGDPEQAYARADLWSNGRPAGTAWVSQVDAGTSVKLRARGLPVRRAMVYELWCVDEHGRWINGGSFRARTDGSAAAELTAAVRPGEYHLVVVTRPSRAGGHGREVMRGELVY